MEWNQPILDRILAEYPDALAAAHWTEQKNSAGFSGARIWKGETASNAAYCLRWNEINAQRPHIDWIHKLMILARERGCTFIPQLVPARSGRTWVDWDPTNAIAEMSTWMSGQAITTGKPSERQQQAAIVALCELHDAWTPRILREEPCPGVQKRITALTSIDTLIHSGWKPTSLSPVNRSLRRRFLDIWPHLPFWIRRAHEKLLPWMTQALPVQACHGDLWAAHLLFSGEQLTGMIDFAAMTIDHVATDLARLLGSWFPNDRDIFRQRVAQYEALRKLPYSLIDLVEALDWSGCVVSVLTWIRRLELENRVYADPTTVVTRVESLLERLTGLTW